METKTKVIVGVGTILVLIVVAIGVVIGGFYLVTQKFREPVLREKLDKAIADGKAFGKTTDNAGCMKKGLTLPTPTDTFDLSDEEFDQACLDASSPPTDFCTGVDFNFGGTWPDDQCDKLGNKTHACYAAYREKLDFCRAKRIL